MKSLSETFNLLLLCERVGGVVLMVGASSQVVNLASGEPWTRLSTQEPRAKHRAAGSKDVPQLQIQLVQKVTLRTTGLLVKAQASRQALPGA